MNKTQTVRIYYPGTSDKNIQDMTEAEFDDYLSHCKKDMIRAFNISKKHYLSKWNHRPTEENKLFAQLMEVELESYLKKKIAEIDAKNNNNTKV